MVISNPKVAERLNKEFVPIYIGNETSPALFNPASSSEEAKLFQSLYRSQVEPQGICVVNTGGQALAWAMNHDNNQEDILSFLDHGLERFHKNPDGKNPVTTERYRHYPKLRLEDYKTEAAKLPIPQGHSNKGGCPSWTQHPKGTVVARLVGRAAGGSARGGSRRHRGFVGCPGG